jgi:putative transposase
MTSFLSSISTPVEQWEKEDMIARKIRIYPTPNQRKLFKQWMGVRRYVYNKVLSAIKNDKENINFMDLRNKHVTSKNNNTLKDWELDVPKDIRAGAIRDLVKNYTTAFSLLKKGNIAHFRMSYCKKKDTPSIEIPKSAMKWNKEKGFLIYETYNLGNIKASKKQSKKDYTEIKHDCRLMFKNNHWYIIIPIKKKRKKVEHIRSKICSLDPGITTFQTVYSPDRVYKFQRDPVVLKRLQLKLDKMQSLRDKKQIGKEHYKRRQRKLYQKQEDLIDDLHFKTANILTKEYKIILLPSFESQKMTKKGKRICRNLLQLKHYRFKQRIKEKCEQRCCELRICTEEYTSKTCGWCGKVNILKNYNVFECSECKLKIDRDINGARNIFIKNLPS